MIRQITLFRQSSVLCVFLLLIFLLNLLLTNLVLAQNEKTPVPVIGHYPLKLYKRGNELTIQAHVSADPQVKRVSLVVWVGEKTAKGEMKRRSKPGRVPVSAVPMSPLGVRSQPNPNADIRGVVNQSIVLKIGKDNEHYFGVITDDNLQGYVPKERVKVLARGYLYSTTLPSEATNRASLTYQIEAVDVHDRSVLTDKYTIRFLTQEHIEKLLAEQFREPEKRKPIYKKVWFWGGLILAGGGAYYLLSGEEKVEPATVDVLIKWQ